MKKIYTLSICFLILFSCNKTEIINLDSKFLNQEELNKSDALKKKISSEFDQYKKEHFLSGRDLANAVSSTDRLDGRPVVDDNYLKKINSISRQNDNNIAIYGTQIKNKYTDMKKYGLQYNFIFSNKSKETIENVKFITIVKYTYNKKVVTYSEHFEKMKILKPNDTLNVKNDFIFNFEPNFKASYFEVQRPDKIELQINATATNSVGFKDNSEETLNIKKNISGSDL